MKKISAKQMSGQSGVTLVEMLISITIFLIVTGSIYGLLRVATLDRNRASRRSDTLKNARAALQLIGRDVQNAGIGYSRSGARVPDDFLQTRLGFPPEPANSERDLLTSVIPGDQANANNLQAGRTDMVAFVMSDVDNFNQGSPLTIKDENGGGSTSRLITKNENDSIDCRINDLYLINDDTTQAIVMLTANPSRNNNGDRLEFAVADPLGFNQARNNSDATKASLIRKCSGSTTVECMKGYPSVSLRKILLVTYKVQPDGTLVRTTYGNNTGNAADQVQVQPLAYGVQDLQITYTMRDGSLVDDPSAPALDPNAQFIPGKRNGIRLLNITMIARDDKIDEATGKAHTVTLNGSFSTKNLEYK